MYIISWFINSAYNRLLHRINMNYFKNSPNGLAQYQSVSRPILNFKWTDTKYCEAVWYSLSLSIFLTIINFMTTFFLFSFLCFLPTGLELPTWTYNWTWTHSLYPARCIFSFPFLESSELKIIPAHITSWNWFYVFGNHQPIASCKHCIDDIKIYRDYINFLKYWYCRYIDLEEILVCHEWFQDNRFVMAVRKNDCVMGWSWKSSG